MMWPLRGVSLQAARSLPVSRSPAVRLQPRGRRMGNVMASKTSSLPAAFRDAAPSQLATFGAGCYWGTEKYFKDFGKAHPGGVEDMRVGFMGDASAQKNPSYRDVCTGQSGHVEVLHLRFDPAKVSYAALVDHFYTFHDPTTLNRQGNDAGPQYASVIFTHTPEQAEVAKAQEACVLDAAAAMMWALAGSEADAKDTGARRSSGTATGTQQAAAAAYAGDGSGGDPLPGGGAVLLQSPQEVRLQVAAKAALSPASMSAAGGEHQHGAPATPAAAAGAASDVLPPSPRDEAGANGAYARLHALKAVELRALLLKVGLPSGGTKAQLVARLTGNYADAADALGEHK